jgi:hypothetical protein
MPSSSSGLSGNEILSHIQAYIGNTSANFSNFLTTTIPLAEFRFCKAHDWSFLTKQNLNLTVSSGTAAYTLTAASIGYYMAASDVRNIFSPASNTYLKKVSLDEIRRMDPDQNDGSTSQYVTHWAQGADNEIILYPQTFKDTALKVDGTITPNALLTLSNYPTIPYRYQDSFIEYLKAIALDRENDTRANTQKQFSMQLIKNDIQDDIGSGGDGSEPRIKAYNEQYLDGVGQNLDQLYINWVWFADGY